MDQQAQKTPRVYEDFQPSFGWTHDEGNDTLAIQLAGFKKNEVRVQLTSKRILRISGEQWITGNRWRRFLKEFPLSADYNTKKIAARFDSEGLLHVSMAATKPPETTNKPPRKAAPQVPPPKPKPAEEKRKAETGGSSRAEEKLDESANALGHKKLGKLIVIILLVVLFGLYFKDAIKSSLAGSQIQDL